MRGRAELLEGVLERIAEQTITNGFKNVVLGLSGGIDSAIVAALAVEALGPERVHAVLFAQRAARDLSVARSRVETARDIGADIERVR